MGVDTAVAEALSEGPGAMDAVDLAWGHPVDRLQEFPIVGVVG